MTRKGSGNRPETNRVKDFGVLLSWHLNRGTRPEGSPETEGVPWSVKEFAGAVGVDERSVRAWCAGEHPPRDLRPIERKLFGDSPAYGAFRNRLRQLHRLTRTGDQSAEGEAAVALSDLGQDTSELIATEFKKSAAVFFVGAGQTLLVARPELILIGFRNLMDRLWKIERADHQERILVWTLDLGRQDFDDPESRLRFMDVEALASRFRAMKRFKEDVTETRWNWLDSRAIIVLHDTCSVRPNVARLPAFQPQHVLFSAIPPRWAGSPKFRTLYGDERLRETNYSIFLGKSAVKSLREIAVSDGIPSDVDRNYEFRYFGNALLKSDQEGGREIRGMKLDALDRGYVEALGTVFVAAVQTLGLRTPPAELVIDGMRIDQAHAVEKLRHHGFLLLRLNEFITF